MKFNNKVFIFGISVIFSLSFFNESVSLNNQKEFKEAINTNSHEYKTFNLGLDDVEYERTHSGSRDEKLEVRIDKEYKNITNLSWDGIVKVSSGQIVHDPDDYGDTHWSNKHTSISSDSWGDWEWDENNYILTIEYTSFGYEGPANRPHSVYIPANIDKFNVQFNAYLEEDDYYKFSVDEIFIEETQQNFYDFNFDLFNDSLETKPYILPNELKYGDLENLIKSREIIESKDNIPYEYTDIVFYDSSNNEISNDAYINSSILYFDLNSNNVSNKVKGTTYDVNKYPETNGHLSFYLPFISYDPIKLIDGVNVYDFNGVDDDDPTDNESSVQWEWQNDGWHLITNELFNLTIDDSDFNKILLKDKKTNETILNYELNSNETKVIEYKQIKENKSNSIHVDVFAENKDLRNYHFTLDFESQDFGFGDSYDNVDVIVKNDNFVSDGFGRIENRLMAFDGNENGVTDDNEIYHVNFVNSNFKIGNLENGKSWKWNYVDQMWQEQKYSELINSDGWIDNPGMYGFSKKDKYGNVSFEIVEYKGEGSNWTDSELDYWDYSNPVYNELDNKVAGPRGIDLDSLSYHETEKLIKTISKMQDLSEVDFNDEDVKNLTLKYESGTKTLEELEPQLEEEIYKQQIKSNSNEFEINWITNENEVLDYGDEIEFEIVTTNDNWEFYGSNKYSFKSNTWLDLSNVKIEELDNVVNDKFASGIEFNKIQYKLEEQIFNELKKYNISSESIMIEWNFGYHEIVESGDKISYKIYSNDDALKNEISGSFMFVSNGETIDISNEQGNSNLWIILDTTLILLLFIVCLILIYPIIKRKIKGE